MSDEPPAIDPASNSAITGPQSEDDWTIHSINIHGVFFERWCQRVIENAGSWKLTTTNYPVAVGGHQSTLDIRADLEIGKRRLILLIECKKNNPEFVNWVFFPKYGATPRLYLPHIETTETTETRHVNALVRPVAIKDSWIRMANDARETRGSYLSYSKQRSDKTKTSNTAITDAANQIALATESVWLQERSWAWDRVSANKSPLHPNTTIAPVIVTSAQMRVCDFNAHDVDSNTGEIPYSKTKISNVPRIAYEFPLPRHLCTPPDDSVEMLEKDQVEVFVRRHIIIVHSTQFSKFLVNSAYELLPPER